MWPCLVKLAEYDGLIRRNLDRVPECVLCSFGYLGVAVYFWFIIQHNLSLSGHSLDFSPRFIVCCESFFYDAFIHVGRFSFFNAAPRKPVVIVAPCRWMSRCCVYTCYCGCELCWSGVESKLGRLDRRSLNGSAAVERPTLQQSDTLSLRRLLSKVI